PAVQVYGNDSPITLEVYQILADGTRGALVDRVNSTSCTKKGISVRLEADTEYMVAVTGTAGRYTLNNGVVGDERYLPSLVHDHVYEVLHPADPIERVVDYPELYVFLADRSYSSVQTDSPRVHLRMYDAAGALTVEGVALSSGGESLDLSRTIADRV